LISLLTSYTQVATSILVHLPIKYPWWRQSVCTMGRDPSAPGNP
jgi:hypothetical protein